MVAECTQSRFGVHIIFLAVSEVGFLGHRIGLKLIFSNLSHFKLLPCHIHTDIFCLLKTFIVVFLSLLMAQDM